MDGAKEFLDAASSEISNFTDDLMDEDFVVLDLNKQSAIDNYLQKILGDVSKGSAGKQLAVGGATGWVTGYVANKVGKTLALTIGTTVLLIQLAQYNGIIKVDWARVKYAMTKARARARAEMAQRRKGWKQTAYRFYEENVFLASGFAGGFLFGFLF